MPATDEPLARGDFDARRAGGWPARRRRSALRKSGAKPPRVVHPLQSYRTLRTRTSQGHRAPADAPGSSRPTAPPDSEDRVRRSRLRRRRRPTSDTTPIRTSLTCQPRPPRLDADGKTAEQSPVRPDALRRRRGADASTPLERRPPLRALDPALVLASAGLTPSSTRTRDANHAAMDRGGPRRPRSPQGRSPFAPASNDTRSRLAGRVQFAVVLGSAALARPSTTGADAASLDVLPRQVEASRSRCASRRTSSPTMRGAHRHGARPATSRAACSCVAISRRRSTALFNRCAYLDPILALLAAMLHASEHANRNTPACRHGLGVLTRSPRPRMGIPRGWGACFARGHRREADGSPSTGFTGPAAPARSARCRTTPDRD